MEPCELIGQAARLGEVAVEQRPERVLVGSRWPQPRAARRRERRVDADRGPASRLAVPPGARVHVEPIRGQELHPVVGHEPDRGRDEIDLPVGVEEVERDARPPRLQSDVAAPDGPCRRSEVRVSMCSSRWP